MLNLSVSVVLLAEIWWLVSLVMAWLSRKPLPGEVNGPARFGKVYTAVIVAALTAGAGANWSGPRLTPVLALQAILAVAHIAFIGWAWHRMRDIGYVKHGLYVVGYATILALAVAFVLLDHLIS